MDHQRKTYIESSIDALFIKTLPMLTLGGAAIFLCLGALDYVSTPDNFRTFLVYRSLIACFLILCFVVIKTVRFRNILFAYKVLLFLAIAASAATIEAMIMKTGGHTSDYYVGMALLGIWVITFLPVRFGIAVLLLLTIYAIYVLPILALERITNTHAFYTSNMFLLALLSTSLALRHFSFTVLTSELGMKYDLETYKNHLEQQVMDRTGQLTNTVERLQREVEERVAAENAIKKAANEWLSTFDSTRDALMLLDQERRIMRVNRAATVFFNMPFAEIIGLTFSRLFPIAETDAQGDPLLRMQLTGRHEEQEIFSAGNRIWTRVSADPVLSGEGAIVGAVVTIRDVNEIKLMQDAIRRGRDDWEETFDAINDAITIHDRDFGIIRSNRAAERMLGLSMVQILSRKCFTSYHGSECPPAGCPSCDTLRTGMPSTNEVFEPHLGKYLEIKALPRFDKQRQVIGLIHVVQDITARKQAENEQRALEAEFRQIQKMDSIGRLAGGIAHDFNNILSVIIGYCYVAQMKLPEDHPARSSLKTVADAGERAAGLTRQLLAFSRKQVLEMRVVNLNAVVESMTKMLKRMIGENIALELRLQEPLRSISADQGQMEQVLMNLLINARDAMPQGGTVTISTGEILRETRSDQEAGSGPAVVLTVADTGEGMSKDVQEKIFEPFFTTKGTGKGTGLGLSTVYGIIKQHNGEIKVESEPGRGTTFTITFPVSVLKSEQAPSPVSQLLKRGSETVLVVDDEPDILNLLVQVLEPLGYRVLTARSGEDALGVSERYPGVIDMLITDIVMPGMNGVEMAETIRHHRPGLLVIFISGYTDNAMVLEGTSDRRQAVLLKPVAPEVLAKRMREMLEGSALSGPVAPEPGAEAS